MRVAVVGASGFIGSHIVEAFERAGHEVVRVIAPRLFADTRTAVELAELASTSAEVSAMARKLQSCDVVLNAAGIANATSTDLSAVIGANALLPSVVLHAASQAGVKRVVHISSASVQGAASLDERPTYDARSAYTWSKALGEQALLAKQGLGPTLSIYRPTSVHGPGRPVTERVVVIARSRLVAVAAPGADPTPQIHVLNVARAALLLAVHDGPVPTIVLHPWEGHTTSSFLETLRGGRSVRQLPRGLARLLVCAAYVVASVSRGRLWPHARRLDLILFGQAQNADWLARLEPDLTRPHPDWRTI